MGRLSLVLSFGLLVGAASARAETTADWRPFIAEAAQRFGIPSGWIERVIQAESGGRTSLRGSPIVSRAGAMGLMQVMPRTWQALRAELGLGTDPFDAHDNIMAGSFYLRLMHDRFGYPGLFAAYNAGPGRYAAVLAGREALPAETTAYLQKVAGPGTAAQAPREDRRSALFAVVAPRDATVADAPAPVPSDALFAVRR